MTPTEIEQANDAFAAALSPADLAELTAAHHQHLRAEMALATVVGDALAELWLKEQATPPLAPLPPAG